MNPLDPRQLTLLRLQWLIAALILFAALLAADFYLARRGWLPFGVVTGVGTFALLIGIWRMPGRRYRAWGYAQSEDELVVKHGLMVRKVTVVPFGRVQHIDVARGPLQRMLGLATLVLNTAGTRGAAVNLPGLDHDEAERLREHVRGKIRQDLT